MSSADLVTTIIGMISSDMGEVMILLGGLGAVVWVMRALVSWSTQLL